MFEQVRSRFRALGWLVALSVGATSAQGQQAVTNQIANPEFRGAAGVIDDIAGSEGTINGDVPTLWRAFVRGGGEVTLERTQLAADALFPGSSPATAMTFTVDSFAAMGDQGFDTAPTRFSLEAGRTYQGTVYMRSNNSDSSTQSVTVSVPVFDETGAFTGRDPGSAVVDVTSEWMRYEGPAFSEQPGTSAELAFRLNAGGSEDSIQIALPTFEGTPLANQAPNPSLSGAGGIPVGDVTGPIPDAWRAFAVNGAQAKIATEPLAANALYPGSPAGQAVRLTADTLGGDLGFDNEVTLFPVVSGRHYQGKVYLRSGNQDMSPQMVGVGLNFFDATMLVNSGVFSGSVGPEWGLYATQSAQVGASAINSSLAIRLIDSGGDNSILIALPEILGPDTVHADGFEPPTPPPAP